MKNHRIKQLALALVYLSLPAALYAVEGAPKAIAQDAEKPIVMQAAQPAGTNPVATPVKIGYIDITKIGLESEYGKAVKAGLLKKKKELEEKVIARRNQLEKQKKTIETKLPGMTPKQREAESKKFQKKVEDLQKLAQGSEEEFMKLQETETTAVYGAIEKVVAEYGKASGLALIMVKKELLYLGSGVEPQDLTETILKKVDEGRKK